MKNSEVIDNLMSKSIEERMKHIAEVTYKEI